MRTNPPQSVPIGVFLIASFYIFGAVVLLISLATNPVQVSRSIADVHGLVPIAGPWVLVVVAALALTIAYGLLFLARWGYFLTIAYLMVFGTVNLVLASADSAWTVHAGNALWSVLVVLYLFFKRGVFLGQQLIQTPQDDAL